MKITLDRRDIAALAERVEAAQRGATAIPKLTDDFPGMTLADGYAVQLPGTLASPYQKTLRKLSAPYVLPVTPAQQPALERRLFGTAYKGRNSCLKYDEGSRSFTASYLPVEV